ncbi:hypothetical protein B0H13DRAFT_663108 [Mycena leptocephala]|nr:hypothetical protein B0H13DRAFT_663108 [Mycena leptocephala]
MKFTITAAAVASLIPGIHGLTVNTPTASGLVVCQPISLTWTDGTAPYYLSIIPGGNAAAPALKIFDPTNGTSLTWKVDIAAGTSITLEIKDSTGTMAYSDAVSIQSASDTSCVTSSTSVSGQNSGVTATTSGFGVTKTSTSAGTISTTTAATTASTSKAQLRRPRPLRQIRQAEAPRPVVHRRQPS